MAGGSVLTLVVIIAMGVGILLDFDRFFLVFHLISFANNLWILDPSSDYLIMLFPQGFWFDAALFCTLATVLGTVVLGGWGWWYLRKTRTLS